MKKEEKIVHTSRKLSLFVISIFFLLFLSSMVSATLSSTLDYDQVLINSNDWKDVYLGLLYAQETGMHGDYILSAKLAPDVFASLPQDKANVLLIESSGKEVIKGAQQQLED